MARSSSSIYEHRVSHHTKSKNGRIDLNHFLSFDPCLFNSNVTTVHSNFVVDVRSETNWKKCSILRPFQRLNERRKFRYKQGEGTAPKIIVEPPTPSPGASFSERKQGFFYSDILFAFLSHVHPVSHPKGPTRWWGYYTTQPWCIFFQARSPLFFGTHILSD